MNQLQTLNLMHQFINGKLPKTFDSFFLSKTSDSHNVKTHFATRSSFYVPKVRRSGGKFNIPCNGPILWNQTDARFDSNFPFIIKRIIFAFRQFLLNCTSNCYTLVFL